MARADSHQFRFHQDRPAIGMLKTVQPDGTMELMEPNADLRARMMGFSSYLLSPALTDDQACFALGNAIDHN
eukprot:scaffold449926_cov18-Prasinocladus_malaysianus.AAC.1